MKYILAEGFPEKLESLPKQTQEKFWKKLQFLLTDLRHPSLHAKKYDEERGIWQARVDKSYRFYFLIDGDAYVLLSIRAHPK